MMVDMTERQRRMLGHGAVVTFLGLLFGFGLLVSLLGGFEVLPGNIVEFEIPGDSGAWARAHAGGIMNGLLVTAGALTLWALQLPERTCFHLYWMLVGTGYANTLFYLGGLLASNRALSFGDNRFGETGVAAIIGVAPAFLFAFITCVAMLIVANHAFNSESTLSP